MAKSSSSRSAPAANSAAGKARARNLSIAAAGKSAGLSSNQIAQQQNQTKSSGSSSSSSSSKSSAVSVPSGITNKNAAAQLRAGNISQAQYNQVMGGGGSSSTISTPTVSYTFTNKATGKTQTVSAADLAKMSTATRTALASQISSGAISGMSGDKVISANNLLSTPATTTTNIVTPSISPVIRSSSKTISQDAYDRVVAQAKAQGKSDADISSAMAKAGYTITPTESITPNTQNDIINGDGNKQTITAPNGKIYDVTVGPDGKASFISQDGSGKVKTFNSLSEATNVINTNNPSTTVQPQEQIQEIIPEEVIPEVDRLKEGESDIQGLDELTNFAQEMNDQYMQTALDAKNQVKTYIDQLAQTNSETANALDSVINNRFTAMNDNFAAISQSIKDLETKANELFDVDAMIARQNRAKQLAESGILTSEQAGSAAQYSMQDYTMNVELKRAELMKQAQEAMTNALKEKGALQDQILQQQGVDAVTKQNMVQQVNTMYQNMINSYADRVNTANAQYDTAIQNARSKQVEVDIQRKLPLIQEEAAKELTTTQKASANSDPQYRYDYVLNKFGEIDANLKSFVANLMGTYKQNGTFMSKDIDAFISELAKKAQSAYKSYNTTSTSSSSSSASSTPSSVPASNTNSSANQSTNTNASTEASWSPSMVGLNFGYQPKITYNPISGTPMQSTVGGA